MAQATLLPWLCKAARARSLVSITHLEEQQAGHVPHSLAAERVLSAMLQHMEGKGVIHGSGLGGEDGMRLCSMVCERFACA